LEIFKAINFLAHCYQSVEVKKKNLTVILFFRLAWLQLMAFWENTVSFRPTQNTWYLLGRNWEHAFLWLDSWVAMSILVV